MKRRTIEARFQAAQGSDPRVSFSTVRGFLRCLEEKERKAPKAPFPESGEPPKALSSVESVSLSEADREALMQEQLREIRERIRRAKRER